MTQQLLNGEEMVNELDISHLTIEDDTPMDNFQSEKHQRLLVEPLYSSKALPAPFLAAANVGLFYQIKSDPIVPDAMLSLRLTLWEGMFEEEVPRSWLRWCDRSGQVIPTGAEGQEIERQRAENAELKAQRLLERLRAMGINPDEV